MLQFKPQLRIQSIAKATEEIAAKTLRAAEKVKHVGLDNTDRSHTER